MAKLDKAEFDKIVAAFEDAGYEVREYSGRGMYGRQCLGVECDNGAGLMVELTLSLCEVADGTDEVADLMEHLRDPKGDSMGRGAILYWPGVEWMADEDDDGEDEHADIEVCTEVYEESHGKRPRGHGRWAFFFQGLPEAGLEGEGFTKPLWVTDDFRKAALVAKSKAAEAGCDAVSVGS